jgi:hypothetical protein
MYHEDLKCSHIMFCMPVLTHNHEDLFEVFSVRISFLKFFCIIFRYIYIYIYIYILVTDVRPTRVQNIGIHIYCRMYIDKR